MKILHVVEAYGGGVQSALQAYIEYTPQFEHVVVAHVRHDTASKLPPNVTFIPIEGGLAAQYRAARRSLREHSPDVIHAHSSWAGMYGRILGRRHSVPVVYSPHAFAFLRTDQSPFMRAIYRSAERRLARYTASFFIASSYESELAKGLGTTATRHIAYSAISPSAATEMTNVAHELQTEDSTDVSYDIVLLGRIAPQKDPAFCLATVAAMRAMGWHGSMAWIGSGSDHDVKALTDTGMVVTGWLPRLEAIRVLGRSRLLFHSGAWEAGVSYAVIEGATMGLPIVTRGLPSATDMEGPVVGATPQECAELMMSLLTDPERYAEATNLARHLVDAQWAVRLREGLAAAYDDAVNHQRP